MIKKLIIFYLFLIVTPLFLSEKTTLASDAIVIEAENFQNIPPDGKQNLYGVECVRFNSKKDKINAEINIPRLGEIAIWLRVWQRWVGDRIAVSVDNGAAKLSWSNTSETKGRWDMENAEVWYWVKVSFGDIIAGPHQVTISSPQGTRGEVGPAIDKIAIAYTDKPAWRETWLTGDMAYLGQEAPLGLLLRKVPYILEAEKLPYKQESFLENIGGADKAVVLKKAKSQIAGTLECEQAENYFVWMRVYYDNKHSFEAPVLHEFSFASYWIVDGAMQRTIYQTDEKHWRWEYLGEVYLTKGKHLFALRNSQGTMKVDKFVFTTNASRWEARWFKKKYPHLLPYKIKNNLSYDDAPVIGSYKGFGAFEKGDAKFIVDKQNVKIIFSEKEGVFVLEMVRPFASNAARAIRSAEQFLDINIKTSIKKLEVTALIRDRSCEYFYLPALHLIPDSNWQKLALPIPKIMSENHEAGNNDGIVDFPIKLTHLIVKKNKGEGELSLGEMEFSSPLAIAGTLRAESVKITLTNNSNISRNALVYSKITEIDGEKSRELMKKSKTCFVKAKTALKLTYPLQYKGKNTFYCFSYSVGAAKVKKLYFARGAKAQQRLDKFINKLERKNGGFKVKFSRKVKHGAVNKQYGKASGLQIFANGIDVTSREYAEKVGYPHKLKAIGRDLSNSAGWPDIHIPPGIVAIDTFSNRVKFAEANNMPAAKAGSLITGFGVPAGAVPEIRGNYLYMHVGEADIFICDISNPAKLKVVGFVQNWYFSNYLHFYKDYAFFNSRHRGTVLIDSIANPYHSGKMRSVNLRIDKYGKIAAVFEKSGIMYTTKYILDLKTDIYNPKPVKSFAAKEIYLSDDEQKAYTKKAGHIIAWDVSNPVNPIKLSEFAASGMVIGIDENYILVQDKNIFTIFENLAKPQLKTRIDFKGKAPSYIHGWNKNGRFNGAGNIFNNRVYIVDSRRKYNQNYSYHKASPQARVYIYSIKGNLKNTYEDPKPSQYYYWTIDKKRKVAYTNDGNGQLRAFDLANPDKLVLLDTILPSIEVRYAATSPEGLTCLGQYFGGGVIVCDTSDPYNPLRKGEFWDGNFNSFKAGFAAFKNIAYLPRNKSDISVVTCKNKAAPKQVFTLPNGNPFVIDDFMYLISKHKLFIYTLADNPERPGKITELNEAGTAVIALQAGKLYTMDKSHIYVFDVTVPGKAKKVFTLSDSGHIGSVFHSYGHARMSRKGYIYVTNMRTYDIPISIFDARKTEIKYVKTVSLLKQTDTVSSSWGDNTLGDCELVGDYLFVPRYGCQIDIYDISDPENPKFVGQSMSGMQWQAGHQVGDFLFTPTIEGLWISDVPSSSQAPENILNYKTR